MISDITAPKPKVDRPAPPVGPEEGEDATNS